MTDEKRFEEIDLSDEQEQWLEAAERKRDIERNEGKYRESKEEQPTDDDKSFSGPFDVKVLEDGETFKAEVWEKDVCVHTTKTLPTRHAAHMEANWWIVDCGRR